MTSVSYSIRSSWADDAQTPNVVGLRVLATVGKLTQLNPTVNRWWALDRSDSNLVSIDDIRSRIAEFTAANVVRDDFGDPCPGDGYGFVCGGSPGQLQTPPVVILSGNSGSNWYNRLEFSVGQELLPPDLSGVTYASYRGAMEILVSEWPCPWLLAYCSVSNSGFPPKPFQNAWIAYLSPTLAAGLAMPNELAIERTRGGGLFLSATNIRFDPTNADQLLRSRALESVMIERVGPPFDGSGQPNRLPARIGPY